MQGELTVSYRFRINNKGRIVFNTKNYARHKLKNIHPGEFFAEEF